MEKIDISHKTIIFTVLFLLGLWVIYQIRFVLLLWFISFILMTALNPMVGKLERLKAPRILAIFLTFVFALSVIGLVFAGIIPTFVDQTIILLKNFDKVFPDIKIFQLDSDVFNSQIETISRNAINVLSIAAGAFSNLFIIFSLFVLTFYLLIERKYLESHLHRFFQDPQKEQRTIGLISTIEHRLGGWVRGEMALMLIVGIMSYIGLSLLNIPFALPLALLAGLLELIPNIGPTISAVPAVILGFTISPAIALAVLILYIAVQQIEANIIVPLVMKKSVGLNPLVTLMSLMIGLTLGGVMGAILAVPIYITADEIIRYIILNRRA